MFLGQLHTHSHARTYAGTHTHTHTHTHAHTHTHTDVIVFPKAKTLFFICTLIGRRSKLIINHVLKYKSKTKVVLGDNNYVSVELII